MKTEYKIPDDATHYFLWWDGLRVYKRNKGKWMYFSGKEWRDEVDCSYHKIRWFFGYKLFAGSYRHKLHKITWSK